MAELSSDHIAHLSRLARIELTSEEEARFAGQLSSIVDYVEQLSGVDTSGIEVPKGVTGLQNVFMEDKERSAGNQLIVDRETLLAGAPAHVEGFVEVRAVMGKDEGESA